MLHLRTIYYFDIEFLSLEETSGLSAEEIRENYDALIDYNLIYQGVEELELPSFPMSREGEIHFEEVKRIFTAIQYLFLVTGILTVFGLPPEDSKERFRKPEADAVPSSLLFPVVLGVVAALDWEQFFVRFHHVFFSNDYWVFNPITDPVIRILPDAFFAHCAAAVLFFILLGSLLTAHCTGCFRRAEELSD